MIYTVTKSVAAEADLVWQVIANVGGWPEWTPTVTAVTPASSTVAEGERYTVKQPGRRPVRYTIEQVEPGRSFRWGDARGGVRQWAEHAVDPAGPGSCTVRLTFAMSGWLGRPIGALASRRIRSMVDTEAESLRSRAEERTEARGR